MSVLTDELTDRLSTMARIEEERRDLAARLFGPVLPDGADQVAVVTVVALHRDALARAGRCGDEGDLLRLLEVAEAAGDEQLAGAAAAVGFRRSYAQLVDLFMASRPALAGELDRLWQLMDPGQGPLNEGDPACP